MGLIITKFRKKKSNIELLEKIDNEINSIENFQRNTEEQRKRIVGKFLVGSVGFYVCSAVLFYFYFYPQNFKERLLYLGPFLLAPAFICFMKRLLTMYFNRKLSKNRNKITELRTKKKQLLEKIMDTETYKVARSILEQYAPEQVRKVTISQELVSAKPSLNHGTPITPNQGIRNRLHSNSYMGSASGQQTPFRTNQERLGVVPSPQITRGYMPAMPAPPSRLYMPPVNRTVFDKMVDYLIGEGPNNRYALICKQCRSHNGMTPMDEFEYTSYKCYYCSSFNPAIKRRPVAPKLQIESPNAIEHSDTSDSEKISGSDSEGDVNELPGNDETCTEAMQVQGSGDTLDNEPNDFEKLSELENRDLQGDSTLPAAVLNDRPSEKGTQEDTTAATMETMKDSAHFGEIVQD